MEEFAKDQPVSDDERRLAEGRKLTLDPLHSDIQPEEVPALESMATERATISQSNPINDSEDTAEDDQLLKPATSKLAEKTILHKAPARHHFTLVIVAAIIAALLIAVIFWFIELR